MHCRPWTALPAIVVAAATATALAGCSPAPDPVVVTAVEVVDGETGEVIGTTTQQVAPSTERGDVDWQAAYTEVLDNASTYDFNTQAFEGGPLEFNETGEYEYALVEANGGGAPELLLSSNSSDAYDNRFSRVLVFTVGDDGKATPTSNALLLGAAGAGGYRATVHASQLDRGLYQVIGYSGTDEATSTWYSYDGAALAQGAPAEETRLTSNLPLHLVIEWTPIDDRGALEAGEPTVSLPEFPRTFVDAPDVVAEGTVVKRTGAELQGAEGMPNSEDPSSEYILLELDSEQEFTDYLRPGGGEMTRPTDAVALGKHETTKYGTFIDGMEWEALLGKRVRITTAANGIHYQSDAGMPMGKLRVGQFQQVEVLDAQ